MLIEETKKQGCFQDACWKDMGEFPKEFKDDLKAIFFLQDLFKVVLRLIMVHSEVLVLPANL